MNGGTCELQDDDNNFICRCIDGFTGLRCESGKDIIHLVVWTCACHGLFLYPFSEQ